MGSLAEDILDSDVIKSQEAHKPGCNREDVCGCDIAEPVDKETKGGDVASIPWNDSNADDGGGCGCDEGEGLGSELGGDIGTSALDNGMTTDVDSSDGSRDTWVSNCESDKGLSSLLTGVQETNAKCRWLCGTE